MPFRILALGSNSSGQLGVGHSNDTANPQPCAIQRSETEDVDECEQVTSIAGGGNHTLVLSSKGRVWAAGRNDDGRCGLETTTEKVESFQQVKASSFKGYGVGAVTSVAAMWEASVFVVDKKMVFTCGSGVKGELGQGADVVGSRIRKRVAVEDELLGQDAEVIEVAAGVNHVLLLSSKGDVFGWGASRKGQLGDEAKEAKIVWKPRKINIPFSVRKVVAGRDFTSVVGYHDEQLLLGDAKYFSGDVNLPLHVAGITIACGWSNIYYHSTSDLYAVGRNDRGQLRPRNLPVLKHFAAGSEHCIACTLDDKVISWGWGEHGNCSRPVDDEKGNVVDRYNTIPVSLRSGETVSGVAAGCATSFIVVERP